MMHPIMTQSENQPSFEETIDSGHAIRKTYRGRNGPSSGNRPLTRYGGDPYGTHLFRLLYRTPLFANSYLRHPAHAGVPLSSRSFRTASPFFTSAAMIAGFPANVTREPLTSTRSPIANFPSSRSTYHSGPR